MNSWTFQEIVMRSYMARQNQVAAIGILRLQPG